ncbi:replication protein A, subunit RPA32 [Meira miltonrushii]|uniref:Replication protein A, subunit RPA32 n=1 Tax=Meira miltonrushii TaxID=1280837 RepID=A0A316V2U0_9BASI|nr:replication protein A, subunit RPA32 [Meira miltonrushii]PWN31840.1 replication protein A, subunit RPA32 [Meira miltonrushii]
MANAFENNAYGQNYSTGGGAGGGFMSGGSQSASQSGGKMAALQTLRPLTIRQILNATQAHAEADFVADGVGIGQLTFVGYVSSITANPTNVIYAISDATGVIEVRVWMDANSGTQKFKHVKDFDFVRVIGGIKSFQQRRYINTGHMRVVTDSNEIFYHQIECIHAHLSLIKEAGGSVGGGAGGQDAYANNDRMRLDDDNKYEQFTNPLHRKIMQIVDSLSEAGNGDTGVHISAIARKIPNSNEGFIRQEVEGLVGEGFLFTAEDENHVLSTTS